MTGYTAQGRKGYHTAPGATPSMLSLSRTPSSIPVNKRWRPRLGRSAGRSGESQRSGARAPLPPAAPPWRASPVRAGAPPVKHLPKSPHWETPAAREPIPSDLLPHRITMTATEPRLIRRGEHRRGQPEPPRHGAARTGDLHTRDAVPRFFRQRQTSSCGHQPLWGHPGRGDGATGRHVSGSRRVLKPTPGRSPPAGCPGPHLLLVVGVLTRPSGPSGDTASGLTGCCSVTLGDCERHSPRLRLSTGLLSLAG